MNFQRLETRIMNDEGFQARPYLDTAGIATIGYGSTSMLGHYVTMDQAAIAAPVARQLLRSDLYGACVDAQMLVGRFDELDHVRQEVLVNLAYNLGKGRLSAFKYLLAALDTLDFDEAAAQMMDSKWYGQVGGRGARLVAAMRTGQWA